MSTLLLATDWLAQIPNPPAKELPGELGNRLNDAIGYGKTIGYALSLCGVLAVAIMLVVGIRGRSDTAKNAITHLPWVILGTILIGGGTGFLEAFA